MLIIFYLVYTILAFLYMFWYHTEQIQTLVLINKAKFQPQFQYFPNSADMLSFSMTEFKKEVKRFSKCLQIFGSDKNMGFLAGSIIFLIIKNILLHTYLRRYLPILNTYWFPFDFFFLKFWYCYETSRITLKKMFQSFMVH